MFLLHRIGPRHSSNWNTLDEILASDGPLSFDGVYTEVYEHYRSLKGKDIIFFVSGKYLGGDNSFAERLAKVAQAARDHADCDYFPAQLREALAALETTSE